MGSFEEIQAVRIEKRARLEQKQVSVYPAALSGKRTRIKDALAVFDKLAHNGSKIIIAGRIRAVREHGGSLFLDIDDGTAMQQIYVKKDEIGADSFALFGQTVDVGDFIESSGTLFYTKKKEKTLQAASWHMLAKSMRPLPEKWHGLKDVEERYRRRYLDLLMNEEVRERFVLRSRIISALRSFLKKEEFLEVETPMLQTIAGGALARPFVTHHNALDRDLYLRIAPELYLKQLLVGGMERVYELGKSFRNEGIDTEHNPEFTSVEWYAAYWDEEAMMTCVERCVAALLKALGTDACTWNGQRITFPKRYRRVTFTDLLRRYALINDYEGETRESLRLRARQFGIEAGAAAPKGKIADEIYKKICRPHVTEPTFVIHHPVDISPLAKRRDENPKEVRRFQLVVAGIEVANGFSELNDPAEQRARFQEQQRIREGGEEEAHRYDEEFIEALEYGMPPAAGVGIGVDRLVMLFSGAQNIREVILFPTMRPRSGNS
ncbi:MAG: lysine--tRNA ligase [Parcubacteria group bacterium]|nr:lysine--tRNA ligase [Parcubacteria group bacterium]